MNNLFLTNYTKISFLDKVKMSLASCSSFSFSVSFIKIAGLMLFYDDIEKALKRGVIGKIITSTYQNFTDIASLEMFLSLSKKYSNFTCHLDLNCFGDNGYHSKGYIFYYKNNIEFIIGSSNITRYALTKNIEWNLLVNENNKNHIVLSILNEFDYLWDKTILLNSQIIKDYGKMLDYAIERWDMDYIHSIESKVLPNFMQKKALKEISRYRDMGVNKALVIAATGSGKTHLSAFDARNFNAQKLLFIVHRETILKDALKIYSSIFGEQKTYGLFTGNEKNINNDFIFTTNLTMKNNLALFEKDEFDYIVVDEVHHAVADTYKTIINYFTPSFLLGLTATPERMDNESVFELFERNVPYELRLRDALENNLIVPFKYYGISDKLLDYGEKDAKVIIKQIAEEIHCEFIKNNIEKYRSKDKLKALAFCKSVEHAKIMAERMNQQGYHTKALSGNSDTGERIQAFKDLQDDTNRLEIIFAVDILNEGVDIPAVNMILFLRPTESSTIFIQQLGRGLRKYENKAFLIVLDFIGNSYTRSVQIALAIGSLSHNINVDKRLLAEFVRNDFKQIDLPIEIHLEKQSKDEILRAIENTNFNNINFLKQEYYNFKKYLNKEATLKHNDFLNAEVSIDLLKYIKKYGCFYNFLSKIDEDIPLFNDDQIKFLTYLSSFIPLIRPHEYFILKELINKDMTYVELKNRMYQYDHYDDKVFQHALKHLQNRLLSDKERLNKINYVIVENDYYKLSIDIESDKQFKECIEDIIEYGLNRYKIEYFNVESQLKLYSNYTRQTLLLALCNHTLTSREGIIWNKNELYIFIDLKKDMNKDERLLYEDEFLSSTVLKWESQTETTLDNKKGQKLINHGRAEIFVRKIKKEDGIVLPYTYIGKGILTNPRPGKNKWKTILFDINLENEIPEYLKYDFEIIN